MKTQPGVFRVGLLGEAPTLSDGFQLTLPSRVAIGLSPGGKGSIFSPRICITLMKQAR